MKKEIIAISILIGSTGALAEPGSVKNMRGEVALPPLPASYSKLKAERLPFPAEEEAKRKKNEERSHKELRAKGEILSGVWKKKLEIIRDLESGSRHSERFSGYRNFLQESLVAEGKRVLLEEHPNKGDEFQVLIYKGDARGLNPKAFAQLDEEGFDKILATLYSEINQLPISKAKKEEQFQLIIQTAKQNRWTKIKDSKNYKELYDGKMQNLVDDYSRPRTRSNSVDALLTKLAELELNRKNRAKLEITPKAPQAQVVQENEERGLMTQLLGKFQTLSKGIQNKASTWVSKLSTTRVDKNLSSSEISDTVQDSDYSASSSVSAK